MDRLYERINWENEPSFATPINEINLNKMDSAIYALDGRTIEMDTSKANKSDALLMFNAISYDEKTGKFTFTRMNGTKVTIDTLLEKVVTNFRYDATTQQLILTTPEGESRIDMSALITQYEFEDTSAIKFDVVNGKVRASLIDGGVTESKLQPNFLADCRTESNRASESALAASRSANKAEASALRAEAAADRATGDYFTSESDYLGDSKEGGLVVKNVKGTSEQDVVGINNLLDFPYSQGSKVSSGITYTVNADGTVNVNGTNELLSTNIFYVAQNLPIESGKRYILMDGLSNSNVLSFNMCCQFYDTDGKVINWSTSMSTKGNGHTNNGASGIFTPPSNAQSMQIWIRVAASYTVNNIVFKPMFTEVASDGTYQTEYERPTSGKGSPSPDIPAEIKNSVLNISTNGKNLFASPYYDANVKTSNGITFIVNSDGSITANGTATANTYYYIGSRVTSKLKLTAGKKYRLSGCPTGGSITTYEMQMGYGDSTGFVNQQVDRGGGTVFTADSIMAKYYAYGDIVIRNGTTVNNVRFTPMLTEVNEDGTYPTDFESYRSTNANTDIKLYSAGEARDELVFENNKWRIVRRIKKTTVKPASASYIGLYANGDSDGFKGYSTDIDLDYPTFRAYQNAYSICTHFKMVYASSIKTLNYAAGTIQAINPTNPKLRLYFKMPDSYSTTALVKAFFDNNNVDVYYEASIPTIEEISDDDAIALLGLKTWNEVTHIIQDSDAKATITVAYGSADGTATSIEGKNKALSNELKIKEMTSALLSATALSEEE